MLVSGLEVVDWGELEKHTKYRNGYNRQAQPVVWFWEVFNELDDDQKRMFLRFSTGTDRLPAQGIAALHFVIQRTADETKLPVAHTCWAIFDLPEYKSKETLKKNLLLAIQECIGFGLI
jgi:hypothetical protein